MPNASDLNLDVNHLKVQMLLKSPIGFGKTIAALSMAVDGPVRLCYFDKKEPWEFFWYKRHFPELVKNISYEVYGAPNAHEFLNFLIDQSRRCDYYGIICDSLTMMTAAAVNWSLGFRNVKSGAKKDPLNPNAVMTIPDFDEYKTETSYVTQALDYCRMLPCNIIWTAHPLPKLEINAGVGEGKMSISKTNSLVSYGSKVAGIVPGQFPEIYHISKENVWDAVKGKSIEKRIVNTRLIGDEITKTALNLPDEIDITDVLFWPKWKELVKERNS